jgi:hypothetical protein
MSASHTGHVGHTQQLPATTSGPLTAPRGLARIPSQPGASTRCRHCASPAPDRHARLVGTWSVVDGRAAWDCPACTRAHLTEIETRLDTAR